MKKLLFLSAAVLSLTACLNDNDGDNGPIIDPVEPYVISFESLKDFNGKEVAPGKAEVAGFVGTIEYDGVLWGQGYAENAKINDADYKMYHGLLFFDVSEVAGFGSYYDDGMQWGTGMPIDTWNGFVVSQICDKSAEATDYNNQFSAWAASGANGTASFAVGYYPDTRYIDVTATPYMIPTIEFKMPCGVESFWVANSTVAYPYVSSVKDARLTLIVTAYLEGEEVGSQEIEMAGAAGKLSDWTLVECDFDSRADKLVFSMQSNDEYYPTYFCIDEISIAL